MSRCDTGSVVEDIMQGLRSAFQMAHDLTKVMITSTGCPAKLFTLGFAVAGHPVVWSVVIILSIELCDRRKRLS